MGEGSLGSIVGGGVSGPVLVLFLFYMNVSGMHLQSLFSSQSLMILAPWIILHIR